MREPTEFNKLLAVAALIYDAETVESLRQCKDMDILHAALNPQFLAERHRLIKDERKCAND